MSSYLSINDLFGKGAEDFMEVVCQLKDELSLRSATYKYLPEEEFGRLLVEDGVIASRIYWEELIGRAHFAAVTSILRSAQWLMGTLVSSEQGLYLPFCANLRSLIESAADSLTGLSGAAATLSENRAVINSALREHEGPFALCQELEDQLIHFSHARKLGAKEAAPHSHSAKTARAYIDCLERLGLPDSHELYGLLCQVTHPAANSVSHFLVQTGESEFTLSPHPDSAAIRELALNYEKFLHSLLRYAFSQPIVLLRVLNYLESPNHHSRVMSGLNLSDMQGWKRCADLMGVAV